MGIPPPGQSPLSYRDLSEIEIAIAIEIETVWDIDFDSDFDETIYMRSPRFHPPYACIPFFLT